MLARKSFRFFRPLQNENCIEWLRINRSTCLAATDDGKEMSFDIGEWRMAHPTQKHHPFKGVRPVRRMTTFRCTPGDMMSSERSRIGYANVAQFYLTHKWTRATTTRTLLEPRWNHIAIHAFFRFSYLSAAHFPARRFVNNMREEKKGAGSETATEALPFWNGSIAPWFMLICQSCGAWQISQARCSMFVSHT